MVLCVLLTSWLLSPFQQTSDCNGLHPLITHCSPFPPSPLGLSSWEMLCAVWCWGPLPPVTFHSLGSPDASSWTSSLSSSSRPLIPEIRSLVPLFPKSSWFWSHGISTCPTSHSYHPLNKPYLWSTDSFPRPSALPVTMARRTPASRDHFLHLQNGAQPRRLAGTSLRGQWDAPGSQPRLSAPAHGDGSCCHLLPACCFLTLSLHLWKLPCLFLAREYFPQIPYYPGGKWLKPWARLWSLGREDPTCCKAQ